MPAPKSCFAPARLSLVDLERPRVPIRFPAAGWAPPRPPALDRAHERRRYLAAGLVIVCVVRTMFGIYCVLIAAGIVFYLIVGVTHQ
jgi:hypothetical protein